MGPLPTLPLALSLLLPFSPSSPPPSPTVIATGVVRDGRVDLTALGLGGGGLGPPVWSADRLRPGQHVTPGGVLVRVRREGVKLDFPSGAELLLSPGGAVHLRGGEHTPSTLHVVELWLADGARVRAVRGAGTGTPFRQVEVITGESAVVLWRGQLALRQRGRFQHPNGTCYLVLGDGDVLYHPSAMGPLLAMERVLCPQDREASFPSRSLVVVGDVLAQSLLRLPAHMPPRSTELPGARETAVGLAESASVLFPAGLVVRPPGALGALVFPLAAGFRLAIEEREGAPIRIGLLHPSGQAVVEWQVGTRTSLHMVRPAGGDRDEPRYYLSGIDLTDETRTLLPVTHSVESNRRGRRILRALGARAPSLRAIPAAARVR